MPHDQTWLRKKWGWKIGKFEGPWPCAWPPKQILKSRQYQISANARFLKSWAASHSFPIKLWFQFLNADCFFQLFSFPYRERFCLFCQNLGFGLPEWIWGIFIRSGKSKLWSVNPSMKKPTRFLRESLNRFSPSCVNVTGELNFSLNSGNYFCILCLVNFLHWENDLTKSILNVCSPKRTALLGLNVGAGIHVKLRLRRPNNDEEFYPYNEVLDTMLHELCHNAHGPHNASFYKLWDELRKVNCKISIVMSGVY